MPLRWAFCSEGSYCQPNSGSDQFEQGSQNNKEGGDRCFFIQNYTWLNENYALGTQHACNNSVPERGWWTPLASWLECGEHVHWSDFQEQASCGSSEKPDSHSGHHCQGIQVTQVAADTVPQVEVVPGTLEELDKVQGVQWTKMSVERREVLFQQLDLSGLEGWSEVNQVATHTLLAEYNDIFTLGPGELGCTNVAKHKIILVDDESFKEWFQRIPPPMMDEVRVHMKEILEVVTICPSQSPWCNAVILVHKKDRGLCFCIDFCKLNARTKKDSYPLPQIQEAIESPMGAGYFSHLDLKVGFWQIAMDETSM